MKPKDFSDRGKQMRRKGADQLNREDRRLEILSYIEKHGVMDKDQMFRDKRGEQSLRTRKKRQRKTIDLHGLNSREALNTVLNAIDECRKKGVGELLVIHGWGAHSDPGEGPVLKKAVHSLLDSLAGKTVRNYRSASGRDGGEGATVVRLR